MEFVLSFPTYMYNSNLNKLNNDIKCPKYMFIEPYENNKYTNYIKK